VTLTWRELRANAEKALLAAGVRADRTEARWMVERVSGYEGAELASGEDEPCTAPAREHLDDMLDRRRRGEPLQYVLGSWSFRGIDLLVDPRVLVPRPETEITAGVAIEELQRLGARSGRSDPWAAGATGYVVADRGTGCGAIALSLTNELPDALVWATDVSDDALAVARANLAGLGLPATRVRLATGDWFDALPGELRGRLRMVVTNPPYVAAAELPALASEVADHEPIGALVSGPTGLEAIETIIDAAPAWLEPHGALVCELAPHQAERAAGLARACGFAEAHVRADLAGRDRVLVARRTHHR
jgi:release factor glutamine methyltransferase